MEELDGLLQGRRCGVMGIWEEEGIGIVLVGDRSWVLVCACGMCSRILSLDTAGIRILLCIMR